MKKKYSASIKDKKDWSTFTKELKNIYDKDSSLEDRNKNSNKIGKIDLHGLSLDKANEIVENFINESFTTGYKKLIIVTGKGIRSQVYKDPYRSGKMSVLRYSVPEYIKNNENLSSKVSRIEKADLKDGGDGAICIFLKSIKRFKE